MKAISIKQPWAGLIASGRKTIEIRSWPTHYRGPLLVCASKSLVQWAAKQFPGFTVPLGSTVAVVELVDVRPATPDDEKSSLVTPGGGDLAWVLDWPRPVKQSPVRGQLGLFDVPDHLIHFLPSVEPPALHERLRKHPSRIG